jgi:hypothetical protein
MVRTLMDGLRDLGERKPVRASALNYDREPHLSVQYFRSRADACTERAITRGRSRQPSLEPEEERGAG